MEPLINVISAKAGIYNVLISLDSRLCGNDESAFNQRFLMLGSLTEYENIDIVLPHNLRQCFARVKAKIVKQEAKELK